MRLTLFVSAAAALSASLVAHADAVYTYTGPTYTSVSGSFNTGESVTGSLTFLSPLAPNLPGTTVTPAFFTFSDGVDTLDSDNSPASGIEIGTDSSGNIDYFHITVTEAPASTIEAQIFLLSSTSQTEVFDAALGAAAGGTGSFTTSSVTPEPSSLGLLGTGLLGIAGVMRRRFA